MKVFGLICTVRDLNNHWRIKKIQRNTVTAVRIVDLGVKREQQYVIKAVVLREGVKKKVQPYET